MGFVVGGYGRGLVAWNWEDVAEAAARVNDCFAGCFWTGGCDRVVVLYLGGTHGGDVGTGAGE